MDTAAARKRLEDTRAELERSISVLKGEYEPDDRTPDYPQDPADAGANISESERSEAILAAAKVQQTEVLNALQRIELGSYGTCVDCGSAVPEGRLEARPEAARCVSCQGKWARMRR
jgi:RNA polymerase-binding transcription factor DksA